MTRFALTAPLAVCAALLLTTCEEAAKPTSAPTAPAPATPGPTEPETTPDPPETPTPPEPPAPKYYDQAAGTYRTAQADLNLGLPFAELVVTQAAERVTVRFTHNGRLLDTGSCSLPIYQSLNSVSSGACTTSAGIRYSFSNGDYVNATGGTFIAYMTRNASTSPPAPTAPTTPTLPSRSCNTLASGSYVTSRWTDEAYLRSDVGITHGSGYLTSAWLLTIESDKIVCDYSRPTVPSVRRTPGRIGCYTLTNAFPPDTFSERGKIKLEARINVGCVFAEIVNGVYREVGSNAEKQAMGDCCHEPRQGRTSRQDLPSEGLGDRVTRPIHLHRRNSGTTWCRVRAADL